MFDMAIRTSTDRVARGPFARLAVKLRSVASALVRQEELGGLSVESRVANSKGRRR